VVATHDPPLIAMADHRIELHDGAVAADTKAESGVSSGGAARAPARTPLR
jgi:ABC-type lipoprotein export system ATPase subunit